MFVFCCKQAARVIQILQREFAYLRIHVDTARAWLSVDNTLGHVLRTPTMNRPSADTYTAEPIIGFRRLSRTMSSAHRTVFLFIVTYFRTLHHCSTSAAATRCHFPFT